MKRAFEFESDGFPRVGEDDELVNSDTMHGHALATFLAAHITEQGFKTGAFIAEDWGWLCPVESDAPVSIWFGCTGEDDRFVVQVHPDKAHVRRWFRKIAVGDAPDRLAAALLDAITETKPKSGPEWID